MTSENDEGLNRFERKMAEMEMSGFSPWPHVGKGLALFVSYILSGWPGLVLLAYLLIGDSLARRVGQERYKVMWLTVALLWPVLLVLDVADLSEGDT